MHKPGQVFIVSQNFHPISRSQSSPRLLETPSPSMQNHAFTLAAPHPPACYPDSQRCIHSGPSQAEWVEKSILLSRKRPNKLLKKLLPFISLLLSKHSFGLQGKWESPMRIHSRPNPFLQPQVQKLNLSLQVMLFCSLVFICLVFWSMPFVVKK
jgi:hypothetical protein